ncbi:MAG TPA: sialate O-acetylesterase [Candidatus Hydrogenedentes bacterium]|nr:sialate O-acetylesterase [Candidatus Hydrogenedentota bacterium]HPG65872.1 sialate O-acetylesterase [Candidatus Hydrogenedentota bacterium]
MRSQRKCSLHIVAIVVLASAFSAAAELTVPSIIGDHMVLQQGKRLPIWGKADPGQAVVVAIAGKEAKAVADDQGRWQVKLPKLPFGDPLEMTISAGDTSLTFSDILVGEVWIGSGQSNMQWTVQDSNNAAEEIAAAAHPNLRLFYVERTVATEPQENCNGAWTACTPETIPGFSAALYYFGRDLHKELGVPVGLIHSSWGGTPVESWTSHAALNAEPMAKPILDRWQETLRNYPAAAEAYQKQMEEWKAAAEKAKAEGKEAPGQPGAPTGPGHPWTPSGLYNAMIAPLVPYAVQGAIWYQGESNAGRAFQYRTIFPLMIEDWRNAWNDSISFYFVQLANFYDRDAEPVESEWAELREAQTMTLDLPKTGMAVIIDIGEAKNIHPKNKQDVGKRLALNALAKDYHKSIPFSGPMYDRMRKKSGNIILSFDHTDGGLKAMGGEPLKGFAIAGADRKFVWANAKIDGNKVVVSSDQVADPMAVRYAWANNPECNLYNGVGLPASPFRTDDWTGLTINAR